MKDQVIKYSRLLLGLLLVFWGINILFPAVLIPQMAEPALEFVSAVKKSGFILPLMGTILTTGGLLLMINRLVALTLLALVPVSVNIFVFHALLDPSGVGGGILVLLLNLLLIFTQRERYRMHANGPAWRILGSSRLSTPVDYNK